MYRSVARSTEEFEAEIEALREKVARLEAASRANLLTGTIVGTRPTTTGVLTVANLEEMVLLVSKDDTIAFLNAPMAKLLDIADKKAVLGQPVGFWDAGVLGPGTLRGLCELARGGASGYAVERVCLGLPEERLPARAGRRPMGDPVLRFSAQNTAGRVQIVVQDVTRLRWLEETFARYVSPQVIEGLEQMPVDEHLGMARKELTILFGDLRGFTRVSQALPPDGVQELVNAFIALVGDTVDELGGTVVNWMGDGFMALFGAPLFYEDHPVRGLVAAVELQKRHAAWSAERRASSLPAPPLGVGLSTGEVVVGNVGSETRLSYTALGHTVNLVARMCNRAEGGQILTTPTTHQAAMATIRGYAGSVPVPHLSFRPKGTLDFKNVAEPVDVVEVVVKPSSRA